MASSMGIGFRGPIEETEDTRTRMRDSQVVLHSNSWCLSIRAQSSKKKVKRQTNSFTANKLGAFHSLQLTRIDLK